MNLIVSQNPSLLSVPHFQLKVPTVQISATIDTDKSVKDVLPSDLTGCLQILSLSCFILEQHKAKYKLIFSR